MERESTEEDMLSSLTEFNDLGTPLAKHHILSSSSLTFPKMVSPVSSPSTFLNSPFCASSPSHDASSSLSTFVSPMWKSPGPWTPQKSIKEEEGTDSFLSFVHTLSPLVEIQGHEMTSPLIRNTNGYTSHGSLAKL